MKISIRKSRIKYSKDELYEFYVERKADQHRAYRNRKKYSKADRRLNKVKEW